MAAKSLGPRLSDAQVNELERIERHGHEGASPQSNRNTVDALMRRGLIEKSEDCKNRERKARRASSVGAMIALGNAVPGPTDGRMDVTQVMSDLRELLMRSLLRYVLTDRGREVLRRRQDCRSIVVRANRPNTATGRPMTPVRHKGGQEQTIAARADKKSQRHACRST
jgi:hypothetical protein